MHPAILDCTKLFLDVSHVQSDPTGQGTTRSQLGPLPGAQRDQPKDDGRWIQFAAGQEGIQEVGQGVASG